VDDIMALTSLIRFDAAADGGCFSQVYVS